MLKNQKILILPLEVKVREFIPKLYLAYNILKRTNIKIIIGGTRFLTNHIKYENCIWFDKNTFPDARNKYPIHKKNKVIMQDEEGPISFHSKEEKNERHPKEMLDQVMHFIYSGQFDLEHLNKKFYKKNFSILGMAKLDLIKNKKIYYNEVKKIKKKYKNFIFIPGHSNHYDMNKTILQKYSKYTFNIDEHLKKRMSDHQKSRNNYYALLELAIKLAKQNPNINIIFRRHPTENEDFIKKKFKNCPNNLKFIYKYTVTPWIIACDYYLHAGCQSVLEAACLKKRIITYMPFNYGGAENFKNFSPFFITENKIINFFDKGNFKIIKFYKVKNLTKIIYNLKDNNFFYQGFIKLLNNKFNKLNSFYAFKKKTSLKSPLSIFLPFMLWIKKIMQKNILLSKFLPVGHLVTKAEKLQKFKDLKKNEIMNWLSIFNKTTKSKHLISVKKLSKATFLLYK